MLQQQKLYDVYVSYPPEVDRERINACLFDNLPDNEAEDLINALAERPQVIIAESCTQDERENAQHYFNYLGLDVIVRQSMELAPSPLAEPEQTPVTPEFHQCPVCMTIIENSDDTECRVCQFHFATANEQTIERKRIEWQEKLAFEHKKQSEIAHKLKLEKEREEKQLRKQIRAELEDKLREELGTNPDLKTIASKQKSFILGVGVALLMFALVAAGYFAAKYL